MDTSLVRPLGQGEPSVTALASGRGAMLRSIDEALDDYLGQVRDRLNSNEFGTGSAAPVEPERTERIAAE
jgi:hypothetical protein